jgi:hypothetical protein
VCLAHRNDHQDLPQVITVIQPGESALLGPAAEAVKSALRHVYLVRGSAGQAEQLLAGQVDQTLEISLKELLDYRPIPGLEPDEPNGYGAAGRHGRIPQRKQSQKKLTGFPAPCGDPS